MSKLDEIKNEEDLLFDIKPLTTGKNETEKDYTYSNQKSDVEKNINFVPSQTIKRKKKIKVITIILVFVLIISVFPAYIFVYKPVSAKSFYSKAVNMYNKKTNGTLPENYLEKFGKLYDVNSDIGGWITIPNSKINYPVVLSSNKDYGYYQDHLFNKTANNFGAVYFDINYNPECYTRNTVICANKNFFGEFSDYFDAEYYKKSPVILMDTIFDEDYWKIFAVLKIVDGNNEYDPTKNNFADDSEFSAYINTAFSLSSIETNVDVLKNDRILSVICDYDGYKVVLVSRRVRSGESVYTDTSSAKLHIPGIESENKVSELKNTIPSDNINSDIIEFEPSESSFEKQNILSSSDFVDSESDLSYSDKTQISSAAESILKNTESNYTADDIGKLTVKNSKTGDIITDDAVNIIASIVEAEVGGFSEIEVLKAQAVAAYTFLLYNNTSVSSPVSVPMKSPQQDALDAAVSVAGQTVQYAGQLCCTYYFPSSAGKTTSCQETWGKSIPYLISVDSSIERNLSNYMTKAVYSSDEIKELAQTKMNISLSGEPSAWLIITSHDSGGEYVTGVSVGGNTSYKNSSGDVFHISGRTIKEVLLSYGITSHAFDIEYNSSSDQFVFTVYGSGHGVGMSQYGAREYARQGYDYIWILEHYFYGASVQ